MRKIFVVFILLFTFLAIPAKSEPQNLEASLNFSARKYILGPNDVISIYIYDFPEFNQEKVRISPDGNIILAPLGVFKAAGLSTEKLYDVLYEKYKFYLKDPQITIKLDETKPFIVYVTGAVLNQGSYELNTNTTANNINNNRNIQETFIERKTPLLSNILVAAGGITHDADLEHVKITNPHNNTEIEINLLELLNGDTQQDVYLMAYDRVDIPKLPTPLGINNQKYKQYVNATFFQKTIPVKVLGYVNKPGLIYLNSNQSLNINSAIASAGGYLTDSAYPPKKIYLSRIDNSGKLVTTIINPMNNDTMLMPNDIIYIPEKARPMAGKAFDYMTRVIRPANEFASSVNNWALMFDPHRYQVIGK